MGLEHRLAKERATSKAQVTWPPDDLVHALRGDLITYHLGSAERPDPKAIVES